MPLPYIICICFHLTMCYPLEVAEGGFVLS